jgi:hypothetical protein
MGLAMECTRLRSCIDTTRKTRNDDEFTLNCRPTVSAVGCEEKISNATDLSSLVKGLAPVADPGGVRGVQMNSPLGCI